MIKQPPTDEVLFKVKARADENDKPFVIECEAEGEPAPTYRWEKNGKPFSWQVYDDRISEQPGRGTLVISSPRTEDIGQYMCFAENPHGIATSNSVFVRQSILNNFKEEPPKTKTVEEGQPFTLPCDGPDGWPKPAIFWMIQRTNGALKTTNSSRMTVDPEGYLHFSNVTKKDNSDEFLYACSASSGFRNEIKLGNRVFLQVIQSGSSAGLQNKHQPVKQYVTRKNYVAYRGKSVKMWCVFGGTPLPEIRWTKKGGALPQGRTTYDNYGKTLVIKHVDFNDEGDYTCEASNGVGLAQSYSIQLKVYAQPYFTKEPESQTAAEGETVTFECEAEGYPAPQIKWVHNGKPIEKAPFNPRRTVTSNSIIIVNLTKQDTGNYGCNASSERVDGYVYKDVFINVLALPPEITSPPEPMMRTVTGSEVRLSCETFGAPKPIVKWYHGTDELTGNRFNITSDGSLRIKDVKYIDDGDYLCNATNRFGHVHARGKLIVKEQTRITQGPQPYEVEAGDTATFRCNAVADTDLRLEINWLKDGRRIDFDSEPRFIQTNDNSLTITKTTELDSGSYTCQALTELDEDRQTASLIVQDVPNPPKLLWVECNSKDASVVWEPRGDNRAPILTYKIQYNTTFLSDTWETAADFVPATATTFKVSMSPWTNYTFRVIARNKVGDSLPSGHSKVCLTPEDVPYKNPDNVMGRGHAPNNLVISWTRMPQIEHNAPKFKYRIYYKLDEPGKTWNIEDIADWKQKELVIPNTDTYTRYKLKVVAHNQRGEANIAAQEVIGYSGESEPSEAPKLFTLREVMGPRSALVSWEPVSKESLSGEFKGYKIQTWTRESGEKKYREIIMVPDTTQALVTSFKPHAENFARILAFNGAYEGPPSNVIRFSTPEGLPGPIDMLECFPMGSSALLLQWKSPAEANGVLTGYRIYYSKVTGTHIGPELEREPRIFNNRTDKAKLAGLEAHSKYRVTIKATTRAGEGLGYYTECDTNPQAREAPSMPNFKYTYLQSDQVNQLPRIKVTWQPFVDGNPGSHFYVQYRKLKETTWLKTEDQLNENSIVVKGLEPGHTYQFRVVAVDGMYQTPSRIQDVHTYATFPPMDSINQSTVASSGWFIGMILALLFLIAVCVTVCLIKRNRGGKYAVQEQEVAHGRGVDYDDGGGFMEYTQPIGGAMKQPSMASDLRTPEEEDNESMADYADGVGDGLMEEDGSFIGKYANNRNPEQSSAFATLV